MEGVSWFLAISALFGCLLLSVLTYIVLLLAWLHAKYDHLPGPKRTSFFMGNASQLFKEARAHNEDYADKEKKILKLPAGIVFKNWAELYGDTFILFIFHRPLIISRSPNVLKHVLVHADQRDFPKSKTIPVRYLYDVRYMGDGLATEIDHDAWYPRRKLMDPVFHRNQLRNSVDAFNVTGDGFVEQLRGYAETGDSLQLSPILHYTTLDVIFRTMFSMDFASADSEFHKKAHTFVAATFDGVQKASIPFIKYNPFYREHICNVREQLNEFRAIGVRIVNERKAAIVSGHPVPDDMLTTMVKASVESDVGYDVNVMVDEFITLIVAGMETSANTLGFVFMELGRRPELLQRLVEEVDEVVGKKPFISNEDITKLSFTTMLIKESLRLYPPATGIVRYINKDVEIDGLRLPAGTELILAILAANRNGKYVPDPEVYNPSRFDPKQETRVPMYSFSTFSLGQRNCIGQVFAQMEMKVLIAKFFQHYELILDESETFGMGISATLHPLSGLKCTVKSRA